MAKVLEKAAAVISGWGGLKRACGKGDGSVVRRILADHEVGVGLADVLLMVPGEAKRLQEIIDAGEQAEEPQPLRDRLRVLQRAQPRTMAEVEEIAAGKADLEKRLRAAEAAKGASEYAANDLGSLHGAFSELFDGTSSQRQHRPTCLLQFGTR